MVRAVGATVVAHALAPEQDLLVAVLAVAALVSWLVMALGLAALARRRSWSYFLVTLALATLLVRTLFGVLAVNGLVGRPSHHLVEHGLDILAVALLFGAVYSARTVDPSGGGTGE